MRIALALQLLSLVSRKTHRIVTRVDAEVSGHGNGAAKEEEGVKQIEDDHDERVEGKLLPDSREDKVGEREHREDRHKHGIVHYGGVAAKRVMNHVADERHDEESPEELPAY